MPNYDIRRETTRRMRSLDNSTLISSRRARAVDETADTCATPTATRSTALHKVACSWNRIGRCDEVLGIGRPKLCSRRAATEAVGDLCPGAGSLATKNNLHLRGPVHGHGSVTARLLLDAQSVTMPVQKCKRHKTRGSALASRLTSRKPGTRECCCPKAGRWFRMDCQ
jgi:hypothetical protein